jgi:hypothetical protein
LWKSVKAVFGKILEIMTEKKRLTSFAANINKVRPTEADVQPG